MIDLKKKMVQSRKGKKKRHINSANVEEKVVLGNCKKVDSGKNVSAKQNENNNHVDQRKNILESCQRCGLFSGLHHCSADSENCFKCGQEGHFARVCRESSVLIAESIRENGDVIRTEAKTNKRRIVPLNKTDNNSDEPEGNNYKNKKQESCQEEEKMATENPTSVVDQLRAKANSLYQRKKYKLALSQFTKLIELSPNTAGYYCNRAACLMMMDQYETALINAKKSVEIDPEFKQGYSRLINIAIALGNFVDAEAAITKLTKLDTIDNLLIKSRKSISDAQMFSQTAEDNFAEKNYANALKNIEKVIDICSRSIFYELKKSLYLTLLEKYDEAEILAESVLKRDKLNVEAKYILGICHYQSDATKAMNYFKEVLQLVPDHSGALDLYKKSKAFSDKENEAKAAFHRRKYVKARQIYFEAIEIDPENKGMKIILFCNMAEASRRMGKFENSIEECTKALEIEPNHVQTLKRRGQCYLEMEDYDEAVSDFSKALKIEPKEENQMLLDEARKLRSRGESDYYAILGVKRNASDDELKRAYREKAMQYHPDRHSDASEVERKKCEKKFKNISRAYRSLANRSTNDSYEDDMMRNMFYSWMQDLFNFNSHYYYSRYNNRSPRY